MGGRTWFWDMEALPSLAGNLQQPDASRHEKRLPGIWLETSVVGWAGGYGHMVQAGVLQVALGSSLGAPATASQGWKLRKHACRIRVWHQAQAGR